MKCWGDAVVYLNEALTKGTTTHFGAVFQLSHQKHSELVPQFRNSKGRVVFRGNNVADQTVASATWQELECSASLMPASKVLGTVAARPGSAGGLGRTPNMHPLSPGRCVLEVARAREV